MSYTVGNVEQQVVGLLAQMNMRIDEARDQKPSMTVNHASTLEGHLVARYGQNLTVVDHHCARNSLQWSLGH